jgi:hypothetical protein
VYCRNGQMPDSRDRETGVRKQTEEGCERFKLERVTGRRARWGRDGVRGAIGEPVGGKCGVQTIVVEDELSEATLESHWGC